MRKRMFTFLLLVSTSLAVAQETMNDASVLKLIWAHMSDDVIVSMINSHPGNYDTSPDAISALKKAGASKSVISAIITRASGVTPASAAHSATAAPPATSPVAPTQMQTSSAPGPAKTNDERTAKDATKAPGFSESDQVGTASGVAPIPAGARVAIAPMGGFETYFAAAVREKRVPIILTLDRDSAQYFVVSTNTEWEGFVFGSNGSARWGPLGGNASSGAAASSTRGLEASIMFIDAKTKDVVWAYEVHKSSHGSLLFGTLGARGQQSVAEACAKHLKEYIEKGQ